MVRGGRNAVLLAAVVLSLALPLFGNEPAEYQIGDRAKEDIIATAHLTVVNPDATDALKQKEMLRVPVVIRFYTNAVDDAEAQFRQSFMRSHDNFLDALEKTFGMRVVSAEDIASDKFQSLVTSFQRKNKLFPVNAKLAALWGSGDTGENYETPFVGALRQGMAVPIRDIMPADVKVGSTVRLVPTPVSTNALSASLVEQRGVNIARTNTLSLDRARMNLVDSMPEEQHAAAKYTASFLKLNCTIETALTAELRAKHVSGLCVTDDYEPGQVVVHRGQLIDKKAKAALDQLKEKTAAAQVQQLLVSDKVTSAQANERIRWLGGTLAGAVVILVPTIWLLARRKQMVSLVPAMPDDAADWRDRALIAEQRARKAQDAARSGLISQMAFWLSNKFTERLISQQQLLIDAQTKAASEMAELEARLEKIQAPLQDRLAAYERRIAELEKDLAVKGEENRELIKTKIDVVRKQLESKRGIYQLIVNPRTPNAWEVRLKAGVNTFGRSPANDFRIDDPSVSIFHCEIICDETGVTIRDLNSTNGTFVGLNRVQSVLLQPGQSIHLGSVEMTFAGKPAPLPLLAVTQPLAFFPARN